MSESNRNRSRAKSRHSAPSDRPFFPVWAPLLVMIAVAITGLVFAFEKDAAPLSFFVLFAIACVVCTLLVEPRGLFLTVVTQPIYYVIGTMLIGWIAAPANSVGGKNTMLLTTAYPAVEHFLWLAVPFVISIIIAVVRFRRFKADATRAAFADAEARQRRRAADESNRSSYTTVRSRTTRTEPREPRTTEVPHTHTVDELMRRAEERRAARSESMQTESGARRTESELPRPARRYQASNKKPFEDSEFRFDDER